jgi:arylsulfatase A-like enzyme
MKILAASLLAGAALVLAGTAGATAPNLVIVSLDTTRFDHIGHGGHPLPTTPVLDRLAREAHVFLAASSVIPLTGPAHGTMWTGLYPHAHGTIRNGVPMRSDVPTLSELLHRDGYQTAAFVAGWTMRSLVSALNRGFELYDDEMTDRYKLVQSQRPADVVTDRAIGWLRGRKSRQPFFLFVHYFDAHDPYTEHAPWHADFHDGYWSRRDVPDARTREKLAAYDSELAFVDRQLGRLLAELDRLGQLENSWLVVLGDHGDAFGEHGYRRHGRRVHEPALHINWLVRPPGGRSEAQLVAERVSQVDLMPTLVELFDLPPVPMQGTSLVPLLEGRADAPRPTVRFETYTLWSLRRKKLPLYLGLFAGDLKIVLSPRSGHFAVYDLRRDPRELVNVATKHPELSRWRSALIEWWRASKAPPAPEPQLSAEDMERLRQLGYVQ